MVEGVEYMAICGIDGLEVRPVTPGEAEDLEEWRNNEQAKFNDWLDDMSAAGF